jgi:hypothetical protein
VKKLMIAARDINGYGEVSTGRSFNKLTADLPRSDFIEFCKLQFMLFLKQLLQCVIHVNIL